MDQAQLELQLKVWKDLAISKQILMRTAAVALKLDPDCSQEALKEALESAIKKTGETEAKLQALQVESRQQITALENKVAASARAETAAQAQVEQLKAAQENLQQQMAIERASVAKELQRLKDAVAEKDKSFKQITQALSDTPENVLKKMSQLRKQKQDEADARREIETSFNKVQAEKRKVDQQLIEAQQNGARLVKQFRDLHELATKLHEQLKSVAAEGTEVPGVPDMDTDLLESVETGKTVKKDDKGGKKAKK